MGGPPRPPGMPPTVVHAALAGLLGAGVLGRSLTARRAAIVVGAGVIPDLDALLALAWPGAHGAVLHTLLLPGAVTGLVAYDAHHRSRSVLRAVWGPGGVAVVWTALLAWVVAGVGLDLFNVDAAAVLWPLDPRYVVVVGQLVYFSQDGLVQTFVGFQMDWPPVVVDTARAGHFVASPFDVRPGPDPADAVRVVQVVESGWQLLVTAAGTVGLLACVGGEP